VRLDHRVDHHHLVAVGHGPGSDLQQLERQQVGALADGLLESAYRLAMVNTFGGGVNEVQRDIIAMAGLGLPRARR